MTVEEVFCDLSNQFGEDFNWYLIPLTRSKEFFVQELKQEIGKEHFLYDKKIQAVARCASNDDVLYVAETPCGADIYYIVHLTYSENHLAGFPRYRELKNIYAVKDFMEQSLLQSYW